MESGLYPNHNPNACGEHVRIPSDSNNVKDCFRNYSCLINYWRIVNHGRLYVSVLVCLDSTFQLFAPEKYLLERNGG